MQRKTSKNKFDCVKNKAIKLEITIEYKILEIWRKR